MFKTSGFVLRRNDYREYDRIYTVYTSDFGKIPLLVRSAKKIKSKLAPALENFGEIKIDFAKGKVFNHLSGSRTLAVNKNILKDAEKIGLAQDCLYLLDRFIKPEEADENIFSHLKIVLSAIADAPVSVIARRYSDEATPLKTGSPRPFGARDEIFVKISIYFFWKLVELLGYGPRLDECALCGAESGIMNKELWFNITDNILICKNCAGEGFLISGETLENLRKIFCSGLAEFLQTDLDNQLISITEKAKQIKLSEL
ncbi:MAG: DNA repair protein RecO [bacterium]